MSESDLASIRLYKPARILFLPKLEISDQGFAQLDELTSLQRLWIAGSKITRSKLQELAPLQELTELSLTDCDLEAGALDLVEDLLPSLRVLNLSGSIQNEEQFKSLAGLGSLEMLIIENGSSSDETLRDWQTKHPDVNVFRTQRLALQTFREKDRESQGSHVRTPRYGHVGTRVEQNPLSEIYGETFFEVATSISITDENREAAIEAMPYLGTLESVSAVNIRNVTGIVPALAQLPNLKRVTFYRSDIRDHELAGLRELTQLESIDLQRTQVTDAGLVHLQDLTNLKTLRLGGYDTSIRDPGMKYLAGMTNMVELNLSRTNITDAALVHLSGMDKLEQLSLREVQIDEGLVHIANHKGLKQLDLYSTFLSDATVSKFDQFPEMRRLDISNTLLTEKGVGKMQKLIPERTFRAPSIMSAQTHAAAVSLAKMRARFFQDSQARVYFLDLRELEDISPALPAVHQLRETLRDIRLGRHATDQLVSEFAEFPSLEYLDLADGSVTTAGLQRLAEAKNVKRIRLRNRKLSEADMDVIGQMQHLTWLSLSGAELPQSGLEKLRNLSNLQRLYLTGTNWGEADLEIICNFPNIEHLALGRSKVSVDTLTCLQKIPKLRSLNLIETVFAKAPAELQKLQRLLLNCTIDVEP